MITITADKIFRSSFSLKKAKKDSKEIEEIDIKDFVFSMGEHIELGPDVTFSRLFDIIIYHKEFFNILFNAEMNGLIVEDFISDYEADSLEFLPYREYILKLCWAGIVYDIDDYVEFYDQVSFEAFGKIDSRVEGEKYQISVALTPLSEIRDKIVYLDNEFSIDSTIAYGDELNADFMANHRPFTVNNLIGSILFEISQFGTPAERDTAGLEIMKRDNQISDWMDDGVIGNKMTDDVLRDYGLLMSEDDVSDDEDSFWDTLYPEDKINRLVRKSMVKNSDKSDTNLEDELLKAHESEDYERAAEIKKLIDGRDKE